MAELGGGEEDVHTSNSSPGMNLPKQLLLKCFSMQAHTFSAHAAMGAAIANRDLGQAFGSSSIFSTLVGACLVPAGPPQGLNSTSSAAQPMPAAHQRVGEWKTDLKLTLLCSMFFLMCKLLLISERLTASDLLQHLLSHTQLLGSFFRAQLLLNCIVVRLAADFCGKNKQTVNSA